MKQMDYREKSAIPVIESAYDTLTKAEKEAADFFLAEKEREDLSLRTVSDLLNLSEATLVRFAKKCGFKGYRELVFQYEKGLHARKSADHIAKSSIDVLDAYQDLLNKSYSLIKEEQISRIAAMITSARQVFCGGIGSSGYAAREMAYRFMRVGVNIEAIDDIDMMRMIAVFRTEQDLVIGLSLSGMRPEFLEYLKESRARGAKTILITSAMRPEYRASIDEVLLVPSLMHLNQGNLISPQFPLLVMIDILYAAYMRHNRREKEDLHGRTLKVIKAQDKKG